MFRDPCCCGRPFCARIPCAVEGSSAAGPIGGTRCAARRGSAGPTLRRHDSALAEAHQFFDGSGAAVPALSGSTSAPSPGRSWSTCPTSRCSSGAIGIAGVVRSASNAGGTFRRDAEALHRRSIPMWSSPGHVLRDDAAVRSIPGAFPIPRASPSRGLARWFRSANTTRSTPPIQGLTTRRQHLGLRAERRIRLRDAADPRRGDRDERQALLEQLSPRTGRPTRPAPLLNLDFAVTEQDGTFQLRAAAATRFQVPGRRHVRPAAPRRRRRTGILDLGGVVASTVPD